MGRRGEASEKEGCGGPGFSQPGARQPGSVGFGSVGFGSVEVGPVDLGAAAPSASGRGARARDGQHGLVGPARGISIGGSACLRARLPGSMAARLLLLSQVVWTTEAQPHRHRRNFSPQALPDGDGPCPQELARAFTAAGRWLLLQPRLTELHGVSNGLGGLA